MGLGTVLPDLLAELSFMKEWDHDGAKRRTDRKGDDDRQDCLINHIAPLSLMYWVFLVYVLLKN